MTRIPSSLAAAAPTDRPAERAASPATGAPFRAVLSAAGGPGTPRPADDVAAAGAPFRAVLSAAGGPATPPPAGDVPTAGAMAAARHRHAALGLADAAQPTATLAAQLAPDGLALDLPALAAGATSDAATDPAAAGLAAATGDPVIAGSPGVPQAATTAIPARMTADSSDVDSPVAAWLAAAVGRAIGSIGGAARSSTAGTSRASGSATAATGGSGRSSTTAASTTATTAATTTAAATTAAATTAAATTAAATTAAATTAAATTAAASTATAAAAGSNAVVNAAASSVANAAAGGAAAVPPTVNAATASSAGAAIPARPAGAPIATNLGPDGSGSAYSAAAAAATAAKLAPDADLATTPLSPLEQAVHELIGRIAERDPGRPRAARPGATDAVDDAAAETPPLHALASPHLAIAGSGRELAAEPSQAGTRASLQPAEPPANPSHVHLVLDDGPDRVVVTVAVRGSDIRVALRASDDTTTAALTRNAASLDHAMRARGLALGELTTEHDPSDRRSSGERQPPGERQPRPRPDHPDAEPFELED
jgi:hypothetical protein